MIVVLGCLSAAVLPGVDAAAVGGGRFGSSRVSLQQATTASPTASAQITDAPTVTGGTITATTVPAATTTPSITPALTVTATTPLPTQTIAPSPTQTGTPTPTSTVTSTLTASATPTPVATLLPPPIASPTPGATPAPTAEPTPRPTDPLSSPSSPAPTDTPQAPYVRIVVPDGISGWRLSLGSNVIRRTIHVEANTAWAIDIRATTPDGWRMAEYDGHSWIAGGARLGSPLHISVPSQSSYVSDGTPARLAVGSNSQDIEVEFYQELHYADPLLRGGHANNLIVTYEAYATE